MATDPPGLVPGSLLADRYRIDALLGRGGMGVVYRAHDAVLDEAVAVKVLRGERATDALRRRFRAEIKLARRIRHPNVCAIHEYGEQAELAFIAMELVEGEDLRQLLTRRGRLSPREAAGLGRQIAAGLAAIHEAGIVHRDLKPPNAMVDRSGRLRLMDFGIAKALDAAASQHTAVGQVLGTPEYMSPEQASGHPVDARSDLYALGVLLFELLTGRVPFRASTPVATLMQQVSHAVPIRDLAAVPGELRDLVARLLAKSPDERPASAAAVAGELARLEPGQPGAELGVETEAHPAVALPNTSTRTRGVEPPATLRQPVPATLYLPTALTRPPAVDESAPAPTVRDQPRPERSWDDLELAPSVPLEEAEPAPPVRAPAPVRSFWLPLGLLGLAVFGLAFAGLLALRLPGRSGEPRPTTLPALEPVPIVVEETPMPDTRVSAPAPTQPPRTATPPSTAAGPSRPAAPTPAPPRTIPGPSTPPGTAVAEEEPGFGILRIELDPAAEISIDGKAIGTHARHDALLEQGVHVVTLRFPGRQPFERRIEVRAGESLRLGLQLDLAAP